MIFFAPYKVNIPMYAGEFFLCYFFVPYKVNIPMYAGGFKQVKYKEYICWMQVKIYISDQTSLKICNSVEPGFRAGPYNFNRGFMKSGPHSLILKCSTLY